MPPFSPDEKVQAIHVLSALEAARELVAAITRNGGHEKVSTDAVRDELKTLCVEAGRLAVYEARAAARGSVRELSDERLTAAVQELRAKITLSVDTEEILDMSEKEVSDAFDADELLKDHDSEPPQDEEPSEAADAFNL
jgi:hypothetical protein